MRSNAGIKPSRRIAKTLADVIPPARGSFAAVVLPQTRFPCVRRFSQLASHSLRVLQDQYGAELPAKFVSKARPNEMEQLVDHDQPE